MPSDASVARNGAKIHLLDVKPVRSELVYMLVRLDKQYTVESPDEKWEDYYARGLLKHFRTV